MIIICPAIQHVVPGNIFFYYIDSHYALIDLSILHFFKNLLLLIIQITVKFQEIHSTSDKTLLMWLSNLDILRTLTSDNL